MDYDEELDYELLLESADVRVAISEGLARLGLSETSPAHFERRSDEHDEIGDDFEELTTRLTEEALGHDLGFDVLERLWERNNLSEAAAGELAREAQHRSRPEPLEDR